METCSTLPHVAGTAVSLKLPLLVPFYLRLLPEAERVPLLEAYFVIHVKGVVRSWASPFHSDIKGKISCLVPMIPSLEKAEGKPGWSLMEQPGWEVTGRQESSNKILPFQVPACLALTCISRIFPDSIQRLWITAHFCH